MKSIEICRHIGTDGAMYTVTSYGNGTAYAFTRETNKQGRREIKSTLHQGDDAGLFRDQFENVMEQDKLPRYCTALEYLWDECGLGDGAKGPLE